MTTKDYSNWNTAGTAVFLKDKAVIVPELIHMKGNIHTTKALPAENIDAWEAHLDVDMGQNGTSDIGLGGLALYYLRNVDSNENGLFGYSAKFDGAAVVINSMLKNTKIHQGQ